MKKMLCAAFLLILLVMSVPVFAESDIESIITESLIPLTEMFVESSDYNEVTYNKPLHSVIIKSGVSGFADMVQDMIESGLNASFGMWADYKDSTLSFYNSILEFYEVAGMADIGLIFIIVNDNVYIDNDVNGMPSPYLLAVMGGEVCFDIIGELNGY